MTKREARERLTGKPDPERENKEKTVFISGPITGIAQYEDRFELAEQALYEKGFKEVINPATIAYVLPDLPWEAYMESLLPLIKYCDVFYSLKGWKESPGARIEREYAARLGLELMEEKTDDGDD